MYLTRDYESGVKTGSRPAREVGSGDDRFQPSDTDAPSEGWSSERPADRRAAR